MNDKRGFLYIANKTKFIHEALISVKSLMKHNDEKVCLICTQEIFKEDLKKSFDIVLCIDEMNNYTYLSKVVGLNFTPFEKTIFLDSDTFITDKITELFDLLDFVDLATTLEYKLHTTGPHDFKYRNIFPELNSGVIVYKKNPITLKIFKDWLTICEKYNIINDMPGLREAVLKNFNEVKYSILPQLYNTHGFKSMLILNNKIKIIHERLGYKKGFITPHFLPFDEMEKFAHRINKYSYKRLFIPRVGVITYRWSPENIILYLKKRLGYKRISKSKSY